MITRNTRIGAMIAALFGFLLLAAFGVFKLAHGHENKVSAAGQQIASAGLPGTEAIALGAPTASCSASMNANLPYVGYIADANSPTGGYVVRYACTNVADGNWAWKAGSQFPVPAQYVVGLAKVATSGVYADISGAPTKLSQLSNDTGFLNNSTAISGTISVPATLLSLGTTVTPVTNATVAAGTFYLCAFNTSNTVGQTNLDVLANAMSNGTLNVILKNTSATTLTGGYTINYKCIQQ